MKILFSNIGYAKGIGGSLAEHARGLMRHFYSPQTVQKTALSKLRSMIDAEKPDLCCFVEIDQGSFHSSYFNQIQALMDDEYHFHDIAGKYGENSWLGKMPLHTGKSSAFMARQSLLFERLYFLHGSKRLIYRITLPDETQVLFAHFSLNRKTRQFQFREVHQLIDQAKRETILLADFNIMHGFAELRPLIEETGLVVLNREEDHTFTFHRRRLALDLCLCSKNIAPRASVRILPQDFSDHDALLVTVEG